MRAHHVALPTLNLTLIDFMILNCLHFGETDHQAIHLKKLVHLILLVVCTAKVLLRKIFLNVELIQGHLCLGDVKQKAMTPIMLTFAFSSG